MEVIVLCGGFATRLEPIGEFIPKALLTLNGRPLIDYITRDLEKIDSVNRIVISTNNRFHDQFDYWANLKKAAGFKKKLELITEPTTDNGNKFGAIKGIAYAIKEAKISEDFLVIFGDNFYTFDLNRLIKNFSKNKAPAIVAYDIESLESAKKFGVIKVERGRVTEFDEKPENPSSSLVSTGIYFFPKEMAGSFQKYIDNGGKTDEMGYFLKWLVMNTELQAMVPARGEWFDIGTLSTYKELFHKDKKD